MSSRVLMVSNSGSVVGSAEISFWQLIKHLNRQQFEPVVVCPDRGDFCDLIEQLSTEYVLLDVPRPGGFGLFSLPVKQLTRLIKGGGIDLIHVNGSRCMISAGLAGLITSRPVIWHVRLLKRAPLLDWLRTVLATKLIATSQAIAAGFVRVRKGKLSVVPNGVDLTEFRPDESGLPIREEFGWSCLHTIVTIVGSLEPARGQRAFLESAALVVKQAQSARFLVIGEGPDRAELQALSDRLGLNNYVKFTGARRDMPTVIAASDIVVSAAPEGFGRSLVEAMATGRPIVATTGGGAGDIVANGETGILVPPDAPEMMAQALVTLIDAPEEAKLLGQRGLARARESFTAQQHARRVEELYTETIARSRRKSR